MCRPSSADAPRNLGRSAHRQSEPRVRPPTQQPAATPTGQQAAHSLARASRVRSSRAERSVPLFRIKNDRFEINRDCRAARTLRSCSRSHVSAGVVFLSPPKAGLYRFRGLPSTCTLQQLPILAFELTATDACPLMAPPRPGRPPISRKGNRRVQRAKAELENENLILTSEARVSCL